MPERLRLTEFVPVAVQGGGYCTIELAFTPGTVWRFDIFGEGTLRHEDLNAAVTRWADESLRNNELRDIWSGALRLQITFTYNVGTGQLRVDQMDARYDGRYRDLVDATTFGDQYVRLIPGNRQPNEIFRLNVDRVQPVRLNRGRDESALQRRARMVNQAERSALGEVVVKKASDTLDRMLTEQQRKDLKDHSYFFVTGSEGTRYRISTDSHSGNVYWVDENGRENGQYCAHPFMNGRDLNGKRGRLPTLDAVIAQKLMLETDEPAFLGMANIFSGGFPPGVRRSAPPAPAFPGPDGGLPGIACDCPWCRQNEVPVGLGRPLYAD